MTYTRTQDPPHTPLVSPHPASSSVVLQRNHRGNNSVAQRLRSTAECLTPPFGKDVGGRSVRAARMDKLAVLEPIISTPMLSRLVERRLVPMIPPLEHTVCIATRLL